MSAQILGIAATFMPWDTTDQTSSPVPLMSQGLSIHGALHEKRQSVILHSIVSILPPIQARESMTLPTKVLVGCLPSWLHSSRQSHFSLKTMRRKTRLPLSDPLYSTQMWALSLRVSYQALPSLYFSNHTTMPSPLRMPIILQISALK